MFDTAFGVVANFTAGDNEATTTDMTVSFLRGVDFGMELGCEAGRLLTYQAAVAKGEGKRYTKLAAMAKLFTSEHAMKTTTKVVQLFGGYGYTKDYPVERMMRDAKITEIYEGTSEVQRIVISANMGL